MTVSFHKYGEGFFPGTGEVQEVGTKRGKYYSINVPLRTGVSDDEYFHLFKDVIGTIIDKYRPGAIVLQCGADSLYGDRLGCFNLSVSGHGRCVAFVRNFGIPMLVVGGGGYTMRNVARCWTYETAVLLNTEISNELPDNLYMPMFCHQTVLHPPILEPLENLNTNDYISEVRALVLANISRLQHAPGIQMIEIPPDALLSDCDSDTNDVDMHSSDTRYHPAEYYSDND
eukprot:TRINITY_DN220_c3_g1_i3.p1 TRINITY_DN220_c3_g1~~TRINITY_DN220_c3_g1_i3.p1  ORF type:complete len:229 (+),score=107.90 TRINITY_DN220_c3_g1_i3:166-852(+)